MHIETTPEHPKVDPRVIPGAKAAPPRQKARRVLGGLQYHHSPRGAVWRRRPATATARRSDERKLNSESHFTAISCLIGTI